MRSVTIYKRLEPGTLLNEFKIREIPIPEFNDNEIRIKVSHAAINIDDIRIAENNFFGVKIREKPSEENPFVPGHDFSGIVDSVGKSTNRLKVGDKVYGQTKHGENGSWAEFCIANEKAVGIVPSDWSMEQAVSYAMGSQVCKAVLAKLGEFKGKTVLIVGISGSIGNIMLQYLHQNGAIVWGVCSGKNASKAMDLGAAKIFDYKIGSFDQQLLKDNLQVDFVVDFVGGKKTRKSAFRVLRKSGRFVTAVGPVDFTSDIAVNFKSIISIGAKLAYNLLKSNFSKPKYSFAVMSKNVSFEKPPLGEKITPMVDSIHEFSHIGVVNAIERTLSHRAAGKVLLKIRPEIEET